MNTHNEAIGQETRRSDSEQNDLALAITRTLNLVSGKWKIRILNQLFAGPRRYNELNRLLPQMSAKVLTQQLQALEHDALIYRAYHRNLGKRVNYTITPQGSELWSSLAHIKTWAGDCSPHAAFDTDHYESEVAINRRSVKDDRSDRVQPVFASTTRAKPRNQFRDPADIRQCQ